MKLRSRRERIRTNHEEPSAKRSDEAQGLDADVERIGRGGGHASGGEKEGSAGSYDVTARVLRHPNDTGNDGPSEIVALKELQVACALRHGSLESVGVDDHRHCESTRYLGKLSMRAFDSYQDTGD